MIENNNHYITKKLAIRSIKSNNRRSIILFFAIALSSFMLLTMSIVGTSYIKSIEKQNIRLFGAKYSAVLTSPTKKQIAILNTFNSIKRVGIFANCAKIEKYKEDSSIHVQMIWADRNFWEYQKKPALKHISGEYPKNKNELMVSKNTLKEFKIPKAKIGDKLYFTYKDAKGIHEEEFIICGIYEDFLTISQIYVSEEFFKTTGHKVGDIKVGKAYIEFENNIFIDKNAKEIQKELHLKKSQSISYIMNTSMVITIFIGIAALVIITVISAYLLIYNILYLSMKNNIRYFGLLEMIGMTDKQIKSMLFLQMIVIGSTGVVFGIVTGTLLSNILIPIILRHLSLEADFIELSIHPWIFIAVICLISITIYLGSRKPAKMAEKISPIEALNYRETTNKKSFKKTKQGNIIWNMAKHHVFQDKKRTILVIASLSLSLSLFLCVFTLIQSNGARTIVSSATNKDIVLENDTLSSEDSVNYKEIFDEKFQKDILKMEGIKDIEEIKMAEIVIPRDTTLDIWMQTFFEVWMRYSYEDVKEEYQNHPEKFASFIIGINEDNFDVLESTILTPIDKEEFLNGEVCIVYRNGLDIEESQIVGKNINFYEKGEKNNQHSIKIAGLTNNSYYSEITGIAPNIIVSNKFIDTKIKKAYIRKLEIVYKKAYNQNTEKGIKAYMEQRDIQQDIYITSKIEILKIIKEAQGQLIPIGIGISAILAVIGILNYINTIISNIQSRLVWLAVLESIGMTPKQIRKMLVQEGGIYALSCIFITCTLGLFITYEAFQLTNYLKVNFQIPWLFLIGGIVILFLICIWVPIITYYYIEKKEDITQWIQKFEQ